MPAFMLAVTRQAKHTYLAALFYRIASKEANETAK